MEAIVRAWSRQLNAGDNAAAARLFELPALIVQGDRVGEFRTFEELAAWHAGLPCSGAIVSLSFEGEFVIAVFELGDRPTSKCDAPPGSQAAARFLIRRGKIVLWEQVAPPGGNESDPSEQPAI